MRLYLVQHGRALSKEEDPSRPLSERGEEDVRAMARHLAAVGIFADRVLHSGKRRAEQTALLLAEGIATGRPVGSAGGLAPRDDPARFTSSLTDDGTQLLVVGHQPFMGCLVSYLLSGDPNRIGVGFEPGSVVCLDQVEGSWSLRWMLRPELVNC